MLCPQIHRQRLVIEFTTDFDLTDYDKTSRHIEGFLYDLCTTLKMTPFMGPFVHNVEDGSSAFMGWMESGTQIHTWHKYKFISIDVYSCKPFEVGDALNTVIKWWRPIVMEVKNV